MGHLPHCIVCSLYSSVLLFCGIYSVCTSIPTRKSWVSEGETHSFRTSQHTQTVAVDWWIPIHFPAAVSATLTSFLFPPSFRQSGRPPSVFLLLLVARLCLHRDFCGSPAQGSHTAHSFTSPRSGAHGCTCPFHPWSCHFSKSAGTPHHLLCEVFTSRSGDSSVWP